MNHEQRFFALLALASVISSAGAGGVSAKPAPRPAAGDRSARTLIEASIQALGGIELLRSLGAVHTEGIEVVNELASHDRPGMPLQTRVFQFTEWRDAKHNRRRYEATEAAVSSPFTVAVVMNGDVAMRTVNGQPTSAFVQVLWGLPALQQSEEALALAPEQALLAALDARDQKVLPDTEVDGEMRDTIEFHRKEAPVRLLLAKDTHLPCAVEITRELPFESFYGELGELTTRINFSSWWGIPGGLRYPREWNVYFRSQLQRVVLINKMELNASPSADSFAIPDGIASAFRNRTVRSIEDYPLGSPADSPPDHQTQEIAPGVVFIPGWMNVVLVKQEDGVVVIEAPISSGYSARVIAESGRRFSGSRVKAVISTSDAPVHFGGAREYVARAIPVYVRDSNVASLAVLLKAPRRILLDAYARAPKPPDFHVVRSGVTVGSGPNRLEIYPVHSAGGERSLMVYLPRHRLLYTADLPVSGRFRPYRFHSFTLADAVAREHLDVERVFGLHAVLMPWKDVENP